MMLIRRMFPRCYPIADTLPEYFPRLDCRVAPSMTGCCPRTYPLCKMTA